MERRVYISIPLALEAKKDKYAFEAYCFAVLVKLHYVSSVINNATIRNIKSKFGMGSTKLQRAINNGIRLGYIKRIGGNIIATSVKTYRAYNAKLDAENGRLTKISDIAKFIEEAIILNHIKKQNDCEDTLILTEAAKNVKVLRRAKKKIKFMLRRGKLNKGLSINATMKAANVKRTRAKQIRRLLENKGLVSKQYRNYIIRNAETYGFDVRKANEVMWEKGLTGFLFRGYDSMGEQAVFFHASNIYRYKCDLIAYVK